MPLLVQKKDEGSSGFVATFLDFLKGELYRERSGPGLVDQLKQTRELAEIMGMNANADRNLEFEKLRYNYLMATGDKNFEREQLRETLKNQRIADRDRWKALSNLGVTALNRAEPLFAAFAKDLPDKLRGNPKQNASQQQQRTQQQAQTQRNLQQASQQPPSNPRGQMYADFICPACNKAIPTKGNPDKILCPGCGQTYEKQQRGVPPQ
jgi:rubrerythrin